MKPIESQLNHSLITHISVLDAIPVPAFLLGGNFALEVANGLFEEAFEQELIASQILPAVKAFLNQNPHFPKGKSCQIFLEEEIGCRVLDARFARLGEQVLITFYEIHSLHIGYPLAVLPGILYEMGPDKGGEATVLGGSISGFSELFGRKPHVKFSFSEIVSESELADLKEEVVRQLNVNQAYKVELCVVRNEQEYWLQDAGYGLWNAKGRLTRVVGFLEDITTRKKAEGSLISALIEGEDRERMRIAKEIHDSLQQTLTAASLNLRAIAQKVTPLDRKIRQKFETGLELVGRAMMESREISHNLMPKAIEEFGLVVAVESMIEELEAASGTFFHFYHNLGEERLPASYEVGIYRMIQEACTNVLKHSSAQKVMLQIMRYTDLLILMIEDDGIGFETTPEVLESFGLQSMRSRAIAMSGVLSVDSIPDHGAVITFQTKL